MKYLLILSQLVYKGFISNHENNEPLAHVIELPFRRGFIIKNRNQLVYAS